MAAWWKYCPQSVHGRLSLIAQYHSSVARYFRRFCSRRLSLTRWKYAASYCLRQSRHHGW